MPGQDYKREANGRRFLGPRMNTVKAVDLLGEDEYAYAQNVRSYLDGRVVGRATSSAAIYTLGAQPHTIRRLNDSTPAGPVGGFVRVIGAAGVMYVNSAQVATGLSGNPVSLVPFRPDTSVQPWMYVADSAPSPNVNIISPAFLCSGMIKIRSDGTTYKTGIREPQAAPSVSFPGGGSGPSQLFYYYRYRGSKTGAKSNPSPVSVPGTNAQSSPSGTVNASQYATNMTFNAAQYEFVSPQLRTTGSVSAGTETDYVTAFGFGFSVPSNVNIDGVQVDLNWLGQNSGTGVLSAVSLFYLGSVIGSAKFPGIQNQSFATDTLQGGNGDTWGAPLTPAIVNDPSFGFGVRITTQSAGGSDRSFIDFMKVTVFYSTQNANITPTASSDPQVDKIDFFRQGNGLANPTYIGTGPNSATVFNDTLSDLAVANNPLLEFDNFEPFPSIDLPRSGVLNASGNVLTSVSGDPFNVNWLPGTLIQIGPSTQVEYTAVRRPSSATTWDFTNNDPTVPTIPNGTNLVWNISEPDLAGQPMPSMWGPTDNTAYMFACGDKLRPGTLYYTKGNNPDSAPDTNQIEVTSPSEPLMNGCIVNGLGMVFSTEHAWLIYPTFTSALATVSGVVGQAFNLIQSITNRGLYIRNAICVEAGQNVFFRAKDGIYVSQGGAGSESITDKQIYNLFPHEGVIPTPVTIGAVVTAHPPDDTFPEKQKLSFVNGYLYYDYQDITGLPRTLVYDTHAKGWSFDEGSPNFTVHANEEGPNVNDTVVGCADNTLRVLNGTGTEVATSILATGAVNSGDARALKRIGDVFVKALVKASNPITVALYTDRYQTLLSGYSPGSLTGTGLILPYIIDFTAGLAQDLIDIEGIFSWPTGSGNTLELWQPDWISLPESTQDRPTDWTDMGSPGNKFVQGLILEANTFGALKTFSIEVDGGVFYTPIECPFIATSQVVRTFTFNPPLVTHKARIVTTDGKPWQIWPGMTWEFEPFPEISVVWYTESMSLGNSGFGHVYGIDLAYIATHPVTVTMVTDGVPGTFSVIFPAAGSGANPAKVFLKVPANKWKTIQFTVSSTVSFYLWEELSEVWIKEWDSTGPYKKTKPFGSRSGIGAQI